MSRTRTAAVFILLLLVGAGCAGAREGGLEPSKRPRASSRSYLTIDVDPAYGQRNQGAAREITLTFSEPIANRDSARAFFAVTPVVKGALEWTAPDRLRFTPSERWAYRTDVSVVLKGGAAGIKSERGHYLAEDFKSFFTVAGDRVIDVDLSDQRLTLLQDEAAVLSCPISSGKAGWNTPTGYFDVYAKDRMIDMASTPEAVEFYRVPEVPFVLWFHGSYSIHGTYWHNEFGRPRSHGCINAPMDAAEFIYDWAPVGTPVNVHE